MAAAAVVGIHVNVVVVIHSADGIVGRPLGLTSGHHKLGGTQVRSNRLWQPLRGEGRHRVTAMTIKHATPGVV